MWLVRVRGSLELLVRSKVGALVGCLAKRCERDTPVKRRDALVFYNGIAGVRGVAVLSAQRAAVSIGNFVAW